MQCKDIPDTPILEFLSSIDRWGTWYEGFDNSVQQGMPGNVPPKLARAKMNQLIRRGLVDGCSCGCRGDYELTADGVAAIEKQKERRGDG